MIARISRSRRVRRACMSAPRIFPRRRCVGVSVGNDAEALQASDADYVGIGPVYATASKGDAGSAIGVAELARLIALCARPAVGIGGIDATNAAAVIDAGARESL